MNFSTTLITIGCILIQFHQWGWATTPKPASTIAFTTGKLSTLAVTSKAPSGVNNTSNSSVTGVPNSPLVTKLPTTVKQTTIAAIKQLIEDSENLHKSLANLEGTMEGNIPNLGPKVTPAAVVKPTVTQTPGPSIKKSINLNLLADAENRLKSAVAAVDPNGKAQPKKQTNKSNKKVKVDLLDKKSPNKPVTPQASSNKAVVGKNQEPTLQDDETKQDMSDHRIPNAAEGDSDADLSGDKAHQQKVIGASIGGSVAGIVLVCGVIAAVVISKRRKRRGDNPKDIGKDDVDCEDIKDFMSTEDVE